MGKHKYIETPEKMWELFESYRDWCKANPRYQYSLSTKTGEATAIPLERPLIFEGFYNYSYDKIGCIDQYFENRDKRYSEYVAICSRIKRVIREDQITGGMAGQYNPSITQRLNGLTERVDTTTKGESINEIKVNIIK